MEPPVIVLNTELQPNEAPFLFVDIADSRTKVVEARLKFNDVPLDIPLEHLRGTTWRAELTPEDLRLLAVDGRIIRYQASITARNAHGEKNSPGEPVSVSVKAPAYRTQLANLGNPEE